MNWYLFCKWLHLVAVISWMAGIFYLYRLLIYLRERGDNPEIHGLLGLMGRRLYRIITRPAMIVSFLAGIGMLTLNPDLLKAGWVHVKLTLVLVMAGATQYAGALVGRFEQKSRNVPTSKRLRLLNELPTILMMIIVWMAVFRPF